MITFLVSVAGLEPKILLTHKENFLRNNKKIFRYIQRSPIYF